MSNVQFYPKGLKPSKKGDNLVERLVALRRNIERDTTQIAEVTVPAVLLLYDVCKALGFTPRQQQKVLGRKGSKSAKKWGETKVHLKNQ